MRGQYAMGGTERPKAEPDSAAQIAHYENMPVWMTRCGRSVCGAPSFTDGGSIMGRENGDHERRDRRSVVVLLLVCAGDGRARGFGKASSHASTSIAWMRMILRKTGSRTGIETSSSRKSARSGGRSPR